MKLKYHTLTFLRFSSRFSPDIAICSFESEGDGMEDLKNAVTQWVNETEEGQNFWDETCNDLNIADLEQVQTPYLLEKWGVFSLYVTLVSGIALHDFDTVLVNNFAEN